MNHKNTTKASKNSIPFFSVPFTISVLFIGLLVNFFGDNKRQYYPGNVTTKLQNKSRDTKGMMQYFYNARKNIKTNSMDYKSMLAADIADRAMKNARHANAASSLPEFSWTSMGPTATGGRTRAFLIDNNDPTHQTVFAGGVSGGIWKSTNGGSFWGNSAPAVSFSQTDTLANMNVSCIAQDVNGVIYIGTGEGLTLANAGQGLGTGLLGGGIFKSSDDGTTWTLLPSTVPTANNDSVAWAFVTQIAIRPDKPSVIYAATNSGLYVSHNSGITWRLAINYVADTNLSGNSLDIKISGDGSIVVAFSGGFGYYCYPQSAPDSSFTEMSNSGIGSINGIDTVKASLIEFAISPTDPNRIYASLIDTTGQFGQGARYSRILMTLNAKTNGGYWYTIGPGGSTGFDPYEESATFANALAVFPNNEGRLLLGGATLWQWTQSTSISNDTVGSWAEISHPYPYYSGDPLYVQVGEHNLVFDQNNPNNLYIGCDGGIFKSSNATNAESIGGEITFLAYNRNYDVTQYYHLCYSPKVYYVNNDPYGSGSIQEGLGTGGGAQDNGSPYITGYGYYPNDGIDMTGGDGGGCAISQLNPNIAYFSIDFGAALEREGNLSTLSALTDAYTALQGRCEGADIEATAELGTGCFVSPVALYENPYDLLNHDSILFTANQNYNTGDTVWPQSANGPLYYPYVLTKALLKDSSLMVPDRVVSKLAVGFNGKNCIWISGQGASTGTVLWKPIGGGDSKPDAFTGTSPVHALAWSCDGDALWAGTEGGTLFRFSNLNALVANDYCSGSLYWDSAGFVNATGDTTVVSTQITLPIDSGIDILSIGTDPNSVNNIMVTTGNYGSPAYVYYSTNAASSSPVFVSAQGNLPLMPVYCCILDIDSAGTFLSGSAMIGTEHGVYYTSNLNGSATVWVKNTNGFPNVLTLDLRQQTLPPYQCNNSGVIYAATHGRGIWSSSDMYVPTAVPSVSSTPSALNNLDVYPNPMTNQGNIEFNLSAADNIIIHIYDIQGKEVKTINLQTQSQGNHIIPFASGDLQPGTYLATLTGINFKKVCKFVVIK